MKSLARNGIRRMLEAAGLTVVKRQYLYDWQINPVEDAAYNPSALPAGAAEILRIDNPKVRSLQTRYAAFDRSVTTPLAWQDGYVRDEDIRYFCGDNAYVWQVRGRNMNIMAYALATYYAKAIDSLGLFELLREDDAFGNFVFQIAEKTVSRDLLDSIIELYFLEKHLGLSSRPELRILDIGAGYGRLAHRAVSALPNVQYLCTDAVAVSTFLCDYYLRYRGVEDRATSVPLDQISEVLRDQSVYVAVNIHSFSECRIEAIDWWLSLISEHHIRHFMVAPNQFKHDGSILLTNDGQDFQPIIEKYGYKLVAKEPKYRDPVVQRYGLNPTHHYLFELDRLNRAGEDLVQTISGWGGLCVSRSSSSPSIAGRYCPLTVMDVKALCHAPARDRASIKCVLDPWGLQTFWGFTRSIPVSLAEKITRPAARE